MAEEGSYVGEDLVGCVETSLSEPSKAADTVIKAVLKGAFHRLIEAAGAAPFALSLSKEQPRTHTHAHTHTYAQSYKQTPDIYAQLKAAYGDLCVYISANLSHKNLIYHSH